MPSGISSLTFSGLASGSTKIGPTYSNPLAVFEEMLRQLGNPFGDDDEGTVLRLGDPENPTHVDSTTEAERALSTIIRRDFDLPDDPRPHQWLIEVWNDDPQVEDREVLSVFTDAADLLGKELRELNPLPSLDDDLDRFPDWLGEMMSELRTEEREALVAAKKAAIRELRAARKLLKAGRARGAYVQDAEEAA